MNWSRYTVQQIIRMLRKAEPENVWADERGQDEMFAHRAAETFFFVCFLATQGYGPGEGRSVQHADIDLKRGTVIIRGAFSGQELRPFPKPKLVRVIPLDGSGKELYLARPTSIDPSAFVLQLHEKPLSITWASKKWREAADQAGYPKINSLPGNQALYRISGHKPGRSAVGGVQILGAFQSENDREVLSFEDQQFAQYPEARNGESHRQEGLNTPIFSKLPANEFLES